MTKMAAPGFDEKVKIVARFNRIFVWNRAADSCRRSLTIQPFKKIRTVALLFGLACACTLPTKPSPMTSRDSAHPGMVKILSAGKAFIQGDDDSSATADEKPTMMAQFTYDYFLDTADVTQKEFSDITGKKPVKNDSKYGVGDDNPVYYVSWYDAILFCNAKSKLHGIDTVYSYSSFPESSSTGSVYNLTGVIIHYDKDGYRLPTESEWEFAARGASSALPFGVTGDSSSAQGAAWFSTNSNGTTHKVASKTPNVLGLYDMAGNVFEWTGDWKCFYSDSVRSATNCIGAPQPDASFEKVIKGGSFNYPYQFLRPSRRSATYPTTLSSTAEYVGFRCARGIVPNPSSISTHKNIVVSPATLLIDDLRNFTGSLQVRLVFVNVMKDIRVLNYVDFALAHPFIFQFTDQTNVYNPTISPDGRYVAYSTGPEGLGGEALLYVRKLDSPDTPAVKLSISQGFVPRWWINRSTGDTCLIFTNSAVSDDNATWTSSKTFLVKMGGGQQVGQPSEIVSDGSFHDGLSFDGRYIVTGFTKLLMKNLQDNEVRQLFLPPLNGKDSAGSTQACNVSICPDSAHPDQCMFLDFGDSRPSALTGSAYGVHQYIFVSGFSGQVSSWFKCPDGEDQWDFPEWSTDPGFAAATVRNASDQSHAIYAIDIRQNKYQTVVEGDELEHPYIWIKSFANGSTTLSADSLAEYFIPPGSACQRPLAAKMLSLWELSDSIELAIIGSSQACNGIDVTKITGLRAFNFAASGGDFLGQENIVLHYVLPHCGRIRVVCSSLDIGWLDNPNGDYSWEEGVGQSTGFKYDAGHNFWQDGLPTGFMNIVNQVPGQLAVDTIDLGFNFTASQGWGSNPPPVAGSVTWAATDSFCQRNLQAISALADSFQSHKVHWILINFPVSPNYKNSPSYSYWGVSWQAAADILQKLNEIENRNPFFQLYDANQNGNHDYGPDDAYDENHLSGVGAAKISTRLDSLISKIGIK
jgi:uncharacterized protein (TIGR02171 family)